MRPKTFIAVLLLILAIILLVQNTQVISIQFLLWKLSMSRIILLFFAMLIGFLLGYFTAKK